MGTKAIFVVAKDEAGKSFATEIVGMTSDGTPNNLKHLAREADKICEQIDGFDVSDNEHLGELLRRLVATDPEWLFLDQISNVEGVRISNSAVYVLQQGKTFLFKGKIEEHNGQVDSFKMLQPIKRLFIYVVREDDSEEGVFTEVLEVLNKENKTLEEWKALAEEISAKVFNASDVLETVVSSQEDVFDRGLRGSLVLSRRQKDEIHKHFN